MSDNHPFINFDPLISWSRLTAVYAEEDFNYAIKLADQRLQKICKLKDEEINYKTVFEAFDNSYTELQILILRLTNLCYVKEDEILREAHNKCIPIEAEFRSAIYHNPELWRTIKVGAEKAKNEHLTEEQKRFIELTVNEFKDNGADLPKDKQKEIEDIDVELSKICKKFQENVKDSMKEFKFYITNEEDLKGLPSSAIQKAKEDAIEKGHPDKWLFTLLGHYATTLPVVMYLDNEKLRKEQYDIFFKVGSYGKYDNTEIIKRITALRDRKAKILGYKTFADFTLLRDMAQNGSKALNFVEDLHNKIYEQFLNEVSNLKEYMNSKNSNAELKPWNFTYWSLKQRKEFYDFDDGEIKPYFSVQKVLDGLFKIAEKNFKIKICQRKTYIHSEGDNNEHKDEIEVYNSDVMYFEVYDIQTEKKIGGVYVDLYPRENKRDGAWAEILNYGDIEKGKPTIVILGTNVNKPIGDKPALLSHYNVREIFHEFGHCLHYMFYNGKIKGLSAMNVPTDFSELPSMFFENFAWERQALDLFAEHYITKEKMPDELFQKMIAAKNYHSAIKFMTQLYYGRIDLALHQEFDKYKDMDPNDVDKAVSKTYRIDYNEPYVSDYYNFNHIFKKHKGGYAAKYYSYMMSDVLAADCFTRFLKEGIMNEKTGMEFRREILEKGYQIPVQDQFKNFMGRDPSQEALLKSNGVI